ncbi:uncharacterized protein NPIL_269651 [Nephila pilipes]|uniref:IRF tryptophan pentad repeat domain-containing protein n=1 Tax=Nephila pilipes TaxID=299642 RepID=A0A8X6TE91_NEPPI|nr:uncharacterized protein NPIL_699491 [Nephila pilipes]GFU05838.1 uncharacterized protein NPIL_269651 [Nephila pilipes]
MAKVLIILWIVIHCDRKTFKGMRWHNRADGIFWLYWRHQSSRSCRENSRESAAYYEYYRAWAKHKNNMKRKQPRDLKAAFRNALEKKAELERVTHLDTKDQIFWRIKNFSSFHYDPKQAFEEFQKPEKGSAGRGKKETCPLQKYSTQNNNEFSVNFGASTSSSCEEFSSFHYNSAQPFEEKQIKSTSNRGRKGAFFSQKHSVQNNNEFPINFEASTSNSREEFPYERKRAPKTTAKTRSQPGRRTWSKRKKSPPSETITNSSQSTYYQSAENAISLEYERSNNSSPLPSFETLRINDSDGTSWNESLRNSISDTELHPQQFSNSSFHEKSDEDLWTPQFLFNADRYTPPQHSSDIMGAQTEIMDFYAPSPQIPANSYPFQPTPPQQNTDILFDTCNTELTKLGTKSTEHSSHHTHSYPFKYSYPFLQSETVNRQLLSNNSHISSLTSSYSVPGPTTLSRCSNLPDSQTTKLNSISRNTYPLECSQYSSPAFYQTSSFHHEPYSCSSSLENAANSCFSFLETPPRESFSDEKFTEVKTLHPHRDIFNNDQSVTSEMANEIIDNLSNSEIENILECVNKILDSNGCL